PVQPSDRRRGYRTVRGDVAVDRPGAYRRLSPPVLASRLRRARAHCRPVADPRFDGGARPDDLVGGNPPSPSPLVRFGRRFALAEPAWRPAGRQAARLAPRAFDLDDPARLSEPTALCARSVGCAGL